MRAREQFFRAISLVRLRQRIQKTRTAELHSLAAPRADRSRCELGGGVMATARKFTTQDYALSIAFNKVFILNLRVLALVILNSLVIALLFLLYRGIVGVPA